jgi:electron transfer flavoprotein alpha/beta subunit
LVGIKPLQNPDEKDKLKGDGCGAVLEAGKMVVNPFVGIAVEGALRIMEKQVAGCRFCRLGRRRASSRSGRFWRWVRAGDQGGGGQGS